MLESAIQAGIVDALNRLPRCRAQKLYGSAWAKQTLDIMCCRDGRFYYLEAKQPGKGPTARQLKTMRDWRETGATVAVVTSVQEALNIVGGQEK